MKLSAAELRRYSRHLILPEFNIEGQKKLKASKVLVVGAGGLGAPLLMYLAAAGIGKIGIVDFDLIEESNLQRQVLFSVDDLGKPKALVAAKKLSALNPEIEITTYNTRLTSENAEEIISKYDIVADGTDNFATRYLVNDACYFLDKVNVYASIFRFEGQASVFNLAQTDGSRGPNYRDLFPTPPPPGAVPSCAEGGVLGVLPGILGSIQANEVIKVAAQIGEPLSGRLFTFDAFSFESRILKFEARTDNPISGDRPTIKSLINYEEFCNAAPEPQQQSNIMKEKTVQELKQMIDQGENFQLIDVREPHEFDLVNLDGELIPLASIPDSADKIKRDVPVIIHCRSGARSGQAVRFLESQGGFKNLYNLKGGILAYADEIDNSLPKY